MKKNLAIINFLSVVLLIMVNYYSQTIQFNNNTVGSLSEEYKNLFTPAGYAFAIWGVIFLALLMYSFYQINNAYFNEKDNDDILKTGPWFFIANIATSAWVVFWLYEMTLISVIIMFVIVFSLLKIVLNTNMERWDAPFKTIALVWWPICLYFGWICIASIANVSAYLAKIGWDGFGISEVTWTITMLVIAVLINLAMIYTRNMREFALVGVWALIAIYVRHDSEVQEIGYVALGGALIIAFYAFYHGYKNRESNPMFKMVTGK